MSQANIPNITPTITITTIDAVNLLLASIALEEIGLAHIINAEAEKFNTLWEPYRVFLSQQPLVTYSPLMQV